MLKDEILEKIFANKEMQMIPIGCQSTAVSVFENVLEELRKEKGCLAARRAVRPNQSQLH